MPDQSKANAPSEEHVCDSSCAHTIDVGYVHVLDDEGCCVENCPHPDCQPTDCEDICMDECQGPCGVFS